MQFRLKTLFVVTAIIGLVLAVRSRPNHPQSVKEILGQFKMVPSDADLKTAVTTLLNPLRTPDTGFETDTHRTYFFDLEYDYYLVLLLDKKKDLGLEFGGASIINRVDSENWEYVFPIRTKRELAWKADHSPNGPYDHLRNLYRGCYITVPAGE